jgi:ribosome-associated protein
VGSTSSAPLRLGHAVAVREAGLSRRVAWAIVTATDTAAELARIAGRAASDKLATDIVLIDVSDRLAITDVFVIATGNNERQVEAIVDEVEEKLRSAGAKPLRREGKRDGRWVLLDYADIVVHVQHAEERVFYALERLWKDCPLIEFTPDVAAVGAADDPAPDAAAPGTSTEHEA